MPGRNLISLISMIFCFLRASASRFCVSYLNLPKSMILHTGGSAFGEISTRSSPASSAICIARAGVTTPTFSPSAPIRRISGDRMRSLMRGPVSRCGGALWGLRAMVVVLHMVASVRKIVPRAAVFNRKSRRFGCQGGLNCARAGFCATDARPFPFVADSVIANATELSSVTGDLI